MLVKMFALTFLFISFSTSLFAAISEKETTTNVLSEKVLLLDKSMEFDYGIDFVPFQFMEAGTLYSGFATSDENRIQVQPFVQLKVKKVAFEFSENLSPINRTYKYRGATLGKLEIDTKFKLLLKLFVIDNPEYSVSFGFGTEYTEVDGKVSMGNVSFPVIHKDYTPVMQIGLNYHPTPIFSFRLNYEQRNNPIRVAIPNTTDLDSKSYKSLAIGMYMRVFAAK